MTTRIRLRRMGSNKRPFFRVVVADQRSPRDGRFIENIGKYHPLDDPSVIEIDQDRAMHWLRVGAQPSNQVRNLMQKIGIWDEFVKERPSAAIAPAKERPDKPRLSKKAKQRAAEAQPAGTTEPESDAGDAEVADAGAAEAVESAAPVEPATEAEEAAGE
jgi:small subunit ribosomal protein S16